MTQLAQIAGRTVDLSHPDVAFLASYLVELERELENAREYLEACRRILGAGEGEMLSEAIRRRLHYRHGPAEAEPDECLRSGGHQAEL